MDEAGYVSGEGAEYVYTPLRVDEWYRGRLDSKEITLRIFGGTARGVTYEADFSPSLEVLNVGYELLVLGSEPLIVPGDQPVSAMTPIGLHTVHGTEVINATLADVHETQAGTGTGAYPVWDFEAPTAALGRFRVVKKPGWFTPNTVEVYMSKLGGGPVKIAEYDPWWRPW